MENLNIVHNQTIMEMEFGDNGAYVAEIRYIFGKGRSYRLGTTPDRTKSSSCRVCKLRDRRVSFNTFNIYI